MSNLNVNATNLDVANELLALGRSNRAKTINELRHKCTNYEEVIELASSEGDYPVIVANAKAAITEIIDMAEINRYEKYLFNLFNKRWNFFKKNDIAQKVGK